MKKLLIVTLAFHFLSVPNVMAPSPVLSGEAGTSEIAHGGGCRKNSPRGQCCHMQKSVGVVHCH